MFLSDGITHGQSPCNKQLKTFDDTCQMEPTRPFSKPADDKVAFYLFARLDKTSGNETIVQQSEI